MNQKDVYVMDAIQREEAKEIAEKGNPSLDDGGVASVMSKKRISIDEPQVVQKQDPLR